MSMFYVLAGIIVMTVFYFLLSEYLAVEALLFQHQSIGILWNVISLVVYYQKDNCFIRD